MMILPLTKDLLKPSLVQIRVHLRSSVVDFSSLPQRSAFALRASSFALRATADKTARQENVEHLNE